MTQPEKEPNYQEELGELWRRAIGLVVLRGTVSYGPLDASFPAGNDGSTKPNGEPAAVHRLVVKEPELPAILQAQGIRKVEIVKCDASHVDGSDWPERVHIESTEANGIETIVSLSEEAPGQFKSTIDFTFDDENIPNPTTLTPEECQEIIEDMFNGSRFWLGLDGPAGDFARSLHVSLSVDRTPTLDDITRIQGIISTLE